MRFTWCRLTEGQSVVDSVTECIWPSLFHQRHTEWGFQGFLIGFYTLQEIETSGFQNVESITEQDTFQALSYIIVSHMIATLF